MNRSIFIVLVFTIISCGCSSIRKNDDNKLLLKRLYFEQKKLNPIFARNLAFSRSLANETIDFRSLRNSEFDTLWLIERVNEVDMSTSSIAWTSEKNIVYLFSVKIDEVNIDEIKYNSFNDPLKSIVEKFDTMLLNDKESPLGAKRVFISEIFNQRIRTFYFSDINMKKY